MVKKYICLVDWRPPFSGRSARDRQALGESKLHLSINHMGKNCLAVVIRHIIGKGAL